MIKHKIESGSWYLLEGMHGCRVGSKGEGELQHVHLDGAEQGTGFFHNQIIVGLICVCTRTVSTQRELMRRHAALPIHLACLFIDLFIVWTLSQCFMVSF